MPKVLHGKIANVLITIWGIHFFKDLSNQPGLVEISFDGNLVSKLDFTVKGLHSNKFSGSSVKIELYIRRV